MRNIPISEVLAKKGRAVHTIRPESTILDAVLSCHADLHQKRETPHERASHATTSCIGYMMG